MAGIVHANVLPSSTRTLFGLSPSLLPRNVCGILTDRAMASKSPMDVEDQDGADPETQAFLARGHRLKAPSRVRTWLWRALLLLLACGWLVPIARMLDGRTDTVRTPLPAQVFERVEKTFMPDDRYTGPSNATHHHWDHLVAAHDALYIPDGHAYGLPRGIFPPFDHPAKAGGTGPPSFYVVTVLHQLHCLVRPRVPAAAPPC